jgi:hypothetical protein
MRPDDVSIATNIPLNFVSFHFHIVWMPQKWNAIFLYYTGCSLDIVTIASSVAGAEVGPTTYLQMQQALGLPRSCNS